MPGLDRSIVEHRLPIKPGYRPYQQGARRCNPKMLLDIKAEITRLIEANFIRQCCYAEWISNVVHVYKKNGKLRVCIDFRDLNKATPMDGYPMPIADMLVDAAAGHKCWIQSVLWMAMLDTIRFLWQKKTCTRLRSDVQDISVYSSG